ncbi:MAG TPA: type IV secretory system conjugative DNA transfer family protein [Candidatus Paceibacterota bacterium]|nr:type IV secretory system conjugative DNA transfer family protein [Candidatus Paceibacterota bacterium]
MNQNDITPIGFYNFRGNRDRKFGIKIDDRRRHIYVVGKTGVGKSTLLENMAIADIRAGKGVAIIDPHGELAEKMLDFVPEERLGDVIYFDPSDMEHPFAFNPMEQVGTEFRHLVASGIMSVFKKIWIDAWSARMEYILNNTLLALLEYPDSTLLGILRMFAEPEYRKKIVSNLQDPVIKAFWQNEFARYSQRLETEALAAIQNKVGQFVSNPLIRNILGQPRSTLNMRQIMDQGKIFIVNLSKGKMGEDNSTLLGAMIITRLQLAAMSRVDVPEEKRPDFFMYVDEFQNFATESFASILSEARKYHLSLTLAHQYIGQLVTSDGNTKVRDAVFGNVGTIVTFRIGAADAEFLEKEFLPEFTEQDLVNLAKANVYIKLMIDGVASRPFSAETLPPQPMPLVTHRDVIIRNGQERYGTPRRVVEDRIASEWAAPTDAVVGEKIERRGERRLGDVLSSGPVPSRPRPPRRFDSPRPPMAAPARNAAAPAVPATLPVEPVTQPEQATPPEVRATPGAAPRTAPEPASAEPAAEPVAAVPKKPPFQRVQVDIDALRRAISESLKKQAGGSRDQNEDKNEGNPQP